MIAVGKTALMVGHDLRNPLQSITYALYQIKEVVKGLPLGIQADQLQTISGAAVTIGDQIEYMDKIVSDLQDYARSLKPRLSEVDLLDLVNTILSTIDVPKNVRVVVDVDETQRMVADPSMIRRVFTSLIVNALQAMPKGGKLTVSATQTKDATFVGFKDTGLGIPRENIDKLGAPLFTTKAKGMGLGLAIGRRMVESHGGTIVFESKVGRGTTVTVKLPHAIEGDRAELRPAERKESSSPHR
jgi:signal transduction histidine kinase